MSIIYTYLPPERVYLKMPLFVFICGLHFQVHPPERGSGSFRCQRVFSKVKLAFLYDAGGLHEEGNRRITGAQWLHVENMFMLPDVG